MDLCTEHLGSNIFSADELITVEGGYILNELFQSMKENIIVVLTLALVEQNLWGHHKNETFLATLISRNTPLF